jgi:hypothetical protein
MAKSPDELLRELETAGVFAGKTVPHGGAGTSPARQTRPRRRITALALLVAALVIAALGAAPIGQVALYPISLFVTLVHEVCHALAAVATGGTVVNLRISSDLSGLTVTSGGVVPVIASAGYVGAALIGALVIVFPGSVSRGLFLLLALAPVSAIVFFHPVTLFTGVWCGAFAAILLLTGLLLPARWLLPVQIFLGLEIGLNALRDLATALLITGSSAHIQTDADLMSSVLFFPPTVWAALWTALSGLVLVLALARVVRRAIYSP